MIEESIKRDLETGVTDNLERMQHSQESYGGVYLARINMMDTDGVISLEIELDEGSIAFTYPVEENIAEECFDYLKMVMEDNDIYVFTVYADFEAAMNAD